MLNLCPEAMSRPDIRDGPAVCAWLFRSFPKTNPKLVEFPSGAWTIDVDFSGERYAIEYSTRLRVVGVSRTASAVFGWEGFEQAVETAEQLEQYLVGLAGSSRAG